MFKYFESSEAAIERTEDELSDNLDDINYEIKVQRKEIEDVQIKVKKIRKRRKNKLIGLDDFDDLLDEMVMGHKRLKELQKQKRVLLQHRNSISSIKASNKTVDATKKMDKLMGKTIPTPKTVTQLKVNIDTKADNLEVIDDLMDDIQTPGNDVDVYADIKKELLAGIMDEEIDDLPELQYKRPSTKNRAHKKSYSIEKNKEIKR